MCIHASPKGQQLRPTSTSFMTGTGLKKCSPPNRSFLSVTLAISVIDREEVLEAKMVDLHVHVYRMGKALKYSAKLKTSLKDGTLFEIARRTKVCMLF